jgi:hypothetical protein
VSLAIEPVFEGMAPADGVPTDVDSFVVSILNPPAQPRDTFIVVREGQDSIRLEITVQLNAAHDTVSLTLSGYNSRTGLLLYQGTVEVPVTVGVPVPRTPVPAAYVGPGQGVDSVLVDPAAAVLQPGQTLQIGYTGFDGDTALPDDSVPVRYSSLNTAVATVNAAGLVTAVADGSTSIFVIALANRNIQDTCEVTVSSTPQPLVSIEVTPGFTALRPGNTQVLTVTGRNGQGDPVSAPGLSFVSRNTAVATVDATTGVVTAVAGGTAAIVASATGGFTDSMVVAVAANGVAVASALASSRAFAAAGVNDTVRAVVAVDLQGVAPEELGSYNATLNWTAGILRYVRYETVAGGFAAPTVNENDTATGQLRFGAADANGAAGPAVALIQIVFVADAQGASPLTLTLTDLSAAFTPFTNLLPAALIYSGAVSIGP